MNLIQRIEHTPIEDLVPYAANARTHSEDQVSQIAASIKEFGFNNPVLIDIDNGIIAGHGRVMAAMKLGLELVPTVTLDHLSDAERRAYILADNRLALNAGWDDAILATELQRLDGEIDLSLLGFENAELDELLDRLEEKAEGAVDEIPEQQAIEVSKLGDVWRLGVHRVMCGDSTNEADVAELMNREVALLIHADPPYGMGKENDGVANDNLYNDKLDQFQLDWWNACRSSVADNGSAYIWGNAPELWRFWLTKLRGTEHLELRNEIVWDKKSVPGMASDLATCYPTASERVLFIQIGQQFIANINSDDFPEAWSELLDYQKAEADKAELTPTSLHEITGVKMYGHWFSKSQFQLIPEKHYVKLQQACPGCFLTPWHIFKKEWDRIKGKGRDVINGMLGASRSYFDNAHEAMRDVWEFPRVVGDDRWEHATPKPVDMMARIMNSSLPRDGLCYEPFAGSGSTLIGAEKTGRRCYTMELQPRYVDVVVRRWQKHTGKSAINITSGKTFDEVANVSETIRASTAA